MAKLLASKTTYNSSESSGKSSTGADARLFFTASTAAKTPRGRGVFLQERRQEMYESSIILSILKQIICQTKPLS